LREVGKVTGNVGEVMFLKEIVDQSETRNGQGKGGPGLDPHDNGKGQQNHP
jgi:hypothetical protein